VLLRKGSRLSVSPVTPGQWKRILALAGVAAADAHAAADAAPGLAA
jgi:predicted RNA-binding protein with PUA-like domain